MVYKNHRGFQMPFYGSRNSWELTSQTTRRRQRETGWKWQESFETQSCSQWHTLSNGAPPLNPYQTVSPIRGQEFKYKNLWGRFSLKKQNMLFDWSFNHIHGPVFILISPLNFIPWIAFSFGRTSQSLHLLHSGFKIKINVTEMLRNWSLIYTKPKEN